MDDVAEFIVRDQSHDGIQFRGAILPLKELERRYAFWALAQTGGHRSMTAEKLGVDRKTLRKWLGEVDRGEGE